MWLPEWKVHGLHENAWPCLSLISDRRFCYLLKDHVPKKLARDIFTLMKPFFTVSALDHTQYGLGMQKEQNTGMCMELLILAETLRYLPGNSKILWLDKHAATINRCLRISSCFHGNLHGSLP